MTASEYLEALRIIDKEIDALLTERSRVFDTILRITADPSVDRVQSGPSSRVETAALRMAELSKHIDAKIDELVDKKEIARGLISRMKIGRERMILIHRYINNLSWGEVAKKMQYDRTAIWRLHPKAIQSFDEILQHFATSDYAIL